MNKFISKDGSVEISIRQHGNNRNAWALFVGGQYKGSKVLPARNTAIVQNFGFAAADFIAA
jgi:hypothetical protein